jgi:hypothetical protein
MATPAAIEQAMQTWNAATIECRTNRQIWRPFGVRHLRRARIYVVTQQCGRGCGVRRRGDMDEDGYMMTGWHTLYPPEGYLLKGLGRVGRDGMAVLRLANIGGLEIEEVTDQ